MTITQANADELELIVRRVFSCNRGDMGGYIDSDHFRLAPFDAALIALAPLWQKDDSDKVEDFLHRWGPVFRDKNDTNASVQSYIEELKNLVNFLMQQ